MRRIRLKSPANIDYAEAVEWYERRQPGLGREFEQELQKLFDRIREHPEYFTNFSPTVQKAHLPRFKHKVLFTVQGDEIGVLAIYHPSRDPEKLRKRL